MMMKAVMMVSAVMRVRTVMTAMMMRVRTAITQRVNCYLPKLEEAVDQKEEVPELQGEVMEVVGEVVEEQLTPQVEVEEVKGRKVVWQSYLAMSKT